MQKILLIIWLLAGSMTLNAQTKFEGEIKNGADSSVLAGATVRWVEKNISKITDSSGRFQFENIPAGKHTFEITYAGFDAYKTTLDFPLSDNSIQRIFMEPGSEEDEDEDEVVVTATRTSRTIANTPTRIEVISGEELAEKGNMKPGDIRMLLSETTGIQTQQTSATSYNAGIRIQGLDGRYTQILKDGIPLYAGFAGGLSILQIAPLDLRQVEVVKGSSSTLYGGGAIAGLVNLVSKTPGAKRELSFIANATGAAGLDLSGFYSERYGKAGLTVYAARNSTRAYDPADIGLSAIPKSERYTINPRLFLYGKNTSGDIGLSYITETRTGGDMNFIKNGTTGYFERNNSDRITANGTLKHRLDEKTFIQFKTSYSIFEREISMASYSFDAKQQLSFSELTFNKSLSKSEWIAGVNFLSDDLTELNAIGTDVRDYHNNTYSVFAQNTWTVSDRFTLESGLRGDYVKDYGFEVLPRVSGMFRISPKVTTRLGGGSGYKTPTVFTEESERIQFRNVRQLNSRIVNNERSLGGNWDVNYRTNLGPVNFSFNHLFYYTRLNDPLVLMNADQGALEFRNAEGHIDTRGMETNIRLIYGDFKLFVGYTYTDAQNHFNGVVAALPLTAKHRLNNVLMYEIEDKLKLGFEAYYFSKQQLSDGATGRSYWIMGFMAEKLWEKFSVFINFENFTDSRQTRFDTIYTGSVASPVFRDIYAPVDGFVINGGLKLRLY
ncbi:MAG: TonB-dependent receptor [Flavitalea sp.]